jgi:glucoamylase
MPRDLPLANGRMLVNFDFNYRVRDVYWPHVGERNQTDGHVNHFGVWVDGAFAWLDDAEWVRDMRYEDDTLVTSVTLRHERLNLTLTCADTVDFDRDALVRRVRVTNHAAVAREVRLFVHYDWHIDESEGANTAYFDPEQRTLVAYKDHSYLLVGGLVGDANAGLGEGERGLAEPMAQWATGNKEVDGQQGTWRDAEDGELSGNPITQGSVDSCAAFHLGSIGPGMDRYCYHWLAAGRDADAVGDLHRLIMRRGPESLLERTRNYWRLWLRSKHVDLGDLPDDLCQLYRRSLLITRTQIDNDGAIVAATDGDVWDFARDSYSYMWPRDGALVTNVMSHAGYGDFTNTFFHFCAREMTDRGYLMHKYTPSGALGSSWHPRVDADGEPQLPIQEDETALVVYALWQHFTVFHEVEFIRPLYRPLVKGAGDFMVRFREPFTRLPAASWDLWEERHGIHSGTVAVVYAGLGAAANFAEAFGEEEIAASYREAASEIQASAEEYLWSDADGRYARMIRVDKEGVLTRDMTIDAALTGLFKFGLVEATSERMRRTMQAVEEHLIVQSEIGGVARYENDYYHQVSKDIERIPGNPWFICACWLAEYHIALANTLDELHAAMDWLRWTLKHALPSGVLAEQLDPLTGAPLSVSPLTWSHAEYAGAIRWYAGRYRRIVNGGK